MTAVPGTSLEESMRLGDSVTEPLLKIRKSDKLLSTPTQLSLAKTLIYFWNNGLKACDDCPLSARTS